MSNVTAVQNEGVFRSISEILRRANHRGIAAATQRQQPTIPAIWAMATRSWAEHRREPVAAARTVQLTGPVRSIQPIWSAAASTCAAAISTCAIRAATAAAISSTAAIPRATIPSAISDKPSTAAQTGAAANPVAAVFSIPSTTSIPTRAAAIPAVSSRAAGAATVPAAESKPAD